MGVLEAVRVGDAVVAAGSLQASNVVATLRPPAPPRALGQVGETAGRGEASAFWVPFRGAEGLRSAALAHLGATAPLMLLANS